MKYTKIFLLACLVFGTGALLWAQIMRGSIEPTEINVTEPVTPKAGMEADLAEIVEAVKMPPPSYEGSSAAGSYLSGRHAQRVHDWDTASRYIDYVLQKDADNIALLTRAMVLAIGDGQSDEGFALAQTIVDEYDANDALALMFLSAQDFKDGDYEAAKAHLSQIPPGGYSAFIMPLLNGWADAALGVYNIEQLGGNSIHLYHAILISEFLGISDSTPDMLKIALSSGDLNAEDVERLASIYAHIGERETALNLFEQALLIDTDNPTLQRKRNLLLNETDSDTFMPVKAPADGVALAFFDMARLLASEYSDESARVFASIAIYLNPKLTQARFLLAEVATRNERFEDAIAFYKGLEPENENFMRSRRRIADILVEQGKTGEAIEELNALVRDYDDLDSIIQIGDIYRGEEDFDNAIKAYNKAEDKLGTIPEEYWHLYYVRGMSYEQEGNWDKAERNLQAALDFQPDHPYVLNYLGYAWADQGENLDQSLDMIKRAVALRPGDGYITDSLGWVYYRMGQYKEAVPYLEQAVELMPYDPIINDHLGDAYWQVGRNLEAEFQWQRAKNHAEDEELITAIEDKLKNGLNKKNTIKDTVQEAVNLKLPDALPEAIKDALPNSEEPKTEMQ